MRSRLQMQQPCHLQAPLQRLHHPRPIIHPTHPQTHFSKATTKTPAPSFPKNGEMGCGIEGFPTTTRFG